MARVFISYRRDDSAGSAGRLYDHVVEVLGGDGVFRDVNAIPLGSDFEGAIEAAMAECDLVLAVIGPRFLDEVNGPRLHDQADHLRRELAAALRSARTRVVPVFVDGAMPPTPPELPGELASLSTRQGFDLRDGRFESDIDFMLERLGLVQVAELDAASPTTTTRTPGPRWIIAGAAAIVIAIAAILAVAVWPGPDDGEVATDSTPTAVPSPEASPTATPPTPPGGTNAGPKVLGVFPPDDPPETYDADTFVDSQPARNNVRFRVLTEGEGLTYQWFSSRDGAIGSEADFRATLTGACFGRTHEITVLVRDAENRLAEAKTRVVIRSALLAEGVICPLMQIPNLDLEVLSSADLVQMLRRTQPDLYAQLTTPQLVASATSQLGEDSTLVLSNIYELNTAVAEAQIMLIDPSILDVTTVDILVDDLRAGPIDSP